MQAFRRQLAYSFGPRLVSARSARSVSAAQASWAPRTAPEKGSGALRTSWPRHDLLYTLCKTCVYIYIYIHTYTYTYTHTYVHTCIHI